MAISKGPIGVAKAANAGPWVEAEWVEAEPLLSMMMENRRVLSYPFEQVWPTAIRYLRVDRGYTVTDRDEEAGYVLFEFPVDGEGRGNGSLEMFRTKDSSGRESVSVSVSTGAGPIHLPNTLLDGLAAKVREERGQPAPPPPKDAPEPPPPPEDGEDPDDGSVPLVPPARDPG
ncbi:hypothetical protein ACNOYE_38980 [Nannocystaceae bacterium ST9]